MEEMPKTEADWKKKLTSEQYHILREKGTEKPFSGKYVNEKSKGEYHCAACGNLLFSSEKKAEENNTPGLAGWPSFEEAIPGSIEYLEDSSYDMQRTEVICAKCKSHLGHLFDDHTTKTGKHYCINSCSLDFNKK